MLVIYGANGYTGELIAREAVRRGLQPVLAGRNRTAVEALGAELKLQARVFGLDEPAAVRDGIAGAAAVLHCAGPFSHTSAAMASACMHARAHYLDITGEIPVFETLAARDGEARQAGVMLLPGSGFDVVPSDCLAAHIARRLPGATRLALAFKPGGRASRGTATTVVENLHRGGVVRRGGKLTPVPAAWKTRDVDFGRGPRTCVTIPWGDVATAWHSTGIPDIEVYLAAPAALRYGLRLSRPFTRLLKSGPVQAFLKRRIQAGPPGPTADERAGGRSLLWGEATDERGGRAVSRLVGPDGYAFTVLTALACVEKTLRGEAKPGFQTPSRAFGPDFVLDLPGVTRTDE